MIDVENQKIILGFDLSLSTSTGKRPRISSCCKFTSPDKFSFSDYRIHPKEIKPFDTDIEKDIVRFQWIATWVCDEIRQAGENLDQVGVEGLAFGAQGKAVTKLAGLQAVVFGKTYLDFNRMIPLIVYPSEARKAHFGTLHKKDFSEPGGKVKDEVFLRLSQKFPGKFQHDNQTDAYLVAWFVWNLRKNQGEN